MLKRAAPGGTFLGLVLGLVVGLGIALAVAIYVSKVPIPFLDKGLSRNPGEEAAEARRNKDWDPNAPLYGRNPIRPLTQKSEAEIAQAAAQANAEAATQTAEAPAKPAPVPAPAPAPTAGPVLPPGGADEPPKPTNTSDPEALNDPLGAFARARANAADPFNYFVQAGAFRGQADAEAFSAKLQQQGFDTRVSEREQAGRLVYRVRVGPLPTKAEAEQIQQKLKSIKVEAALVRVQR